MSRDGAFSRAQQTKNWCVGFSFPPPAYAGIHPTLYLFGFRANALNSHSLPSLPGFDTGSSQVMLSGPFWGFFLTAFGPPGLRKPPTLPVFRGASGGPLGASGSVRGSPEGSGGPAGACAFEGQDVGFGSGFRVLFWAASPACLADPEISAFPGHPQGRPGQSAPRAPSRKPPRLLGLGFLMT